MSKDNIVRADPGSHGLMTGKQHNFLVDQAFRGSAGPHMFDGPNGTAQGKRQEKKIRVFELCEDWIPPKAPYSSHPNYNDGVFEIEAVEEETGEMYDGTENPKIRFPTFWSGSTNSYQALPLYYGIGRKEFAQVPNGYGGATQVWATLRHDRWEIIGGMFAVFAVCQMNADLAFNVSGVDAAYVYWSMGGAAWSLVTSGFLIDVINFGQKIYGGESVLANYSPCENKWTIFRPKTWVVETDETPQVKDVWNIKFDSGDFVVTDGGDGQVTISLV